MYKENWKICIKEKNISKIANKLITHLSAVNTVSNNKDKILNMLELVYLKTGNFSDVKFLLFESA